MSAHPQIRSIGSHSLRVAWTAVRLPLLALLSFLAPVVGTVCAGLMLLGIAVSILFKISAAGPHFPFWHMIGMSLGFGLFIVLYYALIALLSR